MNKEGYPSLEQVLNTGLRALSTKAFEAMANTMGAVVLDTRPPQIFAKGFIPNAINIGIDGGFAPWVGSLLPSVSQPILLITEPGREVEVVTRLARVGYDHSLGYLEGGIETWQKADKQIDSVESIPAVEFARRYQGEKLRVFDVRKESEFSTMHIEGATNLPLHELNARMLEMPKDEPIYLYCGSGYRSMIAASILKSRGWDKLIEIEGGFKALSATNVSTTDYICPSTLKKNQ